MYFSHFISRILMTWMGEGKMKRASATKSSSLVNTFAETRSAHQSFGTNITNLQILEILKKKNITYITNSANMKYYKY